MECQSRVCALDFERTSSQLSQRMEPICTYVPRTALKKILWAKLFVTITVGFWLVLRIRVEPAWNQSNSDYTTLYRDSVGRIVQSLSVLMYDESHSFRSAVVHRRVRWDATLMLLWCLCLFVPGKCKPPGSSHYEPLWRLGDWPAPAVGRSSQSYAVSPHFRWTLRISDDPERFASPPPTPSSRMVDPFWLLLLHSIFAFYLGFKVDPCFWSARFFGSWRGGRLRFVVLSTAHARQTQTSVTIMSCTYRCTTKMSEGETNSNFGVQISKINAN